jgi:hypothetical protein
LKIRTAPAVPTPFTVQEDHNFASDLLVRPGGSDAAGSDSADASDLKQALGALPRSYRTPFPKARTGFLA